MASVNKLFLLDNLVADPNVRYSAKRVAIAEITIAVNRFWTDEGGRKEQTDFRTDGRGRLAISEKRTARPHRGSVAAGYLGRQADWSEALQVEGHRRKSPTLRQDSWPTAFIFQSLISEAKVRRRSGCGD
jgi:Single-strand binding protein family